MLAQQAEPTNKVVYPVEPQMTTTHNRLNADGTPGSSWLCRPASTSERLILELNTVTICCGYNPEVILEENVTTIPPAIAAKGVSQQEWTHWMTRFKKELGAKSVSGMTTFLSFLFLCIPCLCIASNRFQTAAMKLQQEMNEQLLEPRGMYIKTQYGEHQGNEISLRVQWLSIAWTPEEVQKLKSEGHAFAYNIGNNTYVTSNRWNRGCKPFLVNPVL